MEREKPIVRIDSLTIDYWDNRDWVNIVNHISFELFPSETLGMAGESGCGKSSTMYALFGYRRPGSRFREGTVLYQDRDLLRLTSGELQQIRGAHISLVPQNPAGTLTPTMRIGGQIAEVLLAHNVVSSSQEAQQRTIELLAEVDLPEPAKISQRYPFQLSGGQQQRVITAMAIACGPAVLVLDEPTSALDVTTQARILGLFDRLKAERGTSLVFVTHDLAVLAQISDRVAIMYAGELVEIAPTRALYRTPCHPYTRGLISSVPRLLAPQSNTQRLKGLLRRDQLPSGCRFAPRCNYAKPDCFVQPQRLLPTGDGHFVACWLWDEIAALLDRQRSE